MAEDTEGTALDYNDDRAPAPRTNQLTRRSFSGIEMAGDNAQTQALIAKSRADIESRWIMACRRPRDLDEVRQLMLKECSRPGFAEVATYSRPVGKKQNEATGKWEQAYAEGLSIRFAEVALRCMSNMVIECVTIFDGETDRMVRVTATDLESNGTWSRDITIKKTVERKQLKQGQQPLGTRLNSYGDRVFIVEATDSEVAVKEAAEVSKASRTAILRLIPGHLQDEAFDRCRAVAADKAAKDPEGDKNRCLDAFASVQVSKADLEELLGCPISKASPAQITDLRKMFSGIRDGETTWADVIGEARKAGKAPATPATPAQVAVATAVMSDVMAAAGSQASPATPGATQPAPAAQQATPPAARTTTKAKGTEALKSQIGGQSSFAKAAENVRAKEAAPLVLTPPVEIERPCAGCGVPIMCLDSDPPGGKCEACLSA